MTDLPAWSDALEAWAADAAGVNPAYDTVTAVEAAYEAPDSHERLYGDLAPRLAGVRVYVSSTRYGRRTETVDVGTDPLGLTWAVLRHALGHREPAAVDGEPDCLGCSPADGTYWAGCPAADHDERARAADRALERASDRLREARARPIAYERAPDADPSDPAEVARLIGDGRG